MDLGLKGRTALVCAASKGLGKACAMALAREGVSVTITARTRETLEATAAEIRNATGATVISVVGDITTPQGRAEALRQRPTSISSSTTPAARRPAISATGTGTTGSRRSTPTC
jgi:3-oxoacyl-[acyl-carrier protein] reductase